jgi:hypothetical protein
LTLLEVDGLLLDLNVLPLPVLGHHLLRVPTRGRGEQGNMTVFSVHGIKGTLTLACHQSKSLVRPFKGPWNPDLLRPPKRHFLAFQK